MVNSCYQICRQRNERGPPAMSALIGSQRDRAATKTQISPRRRGDTGSCPSHTSGLCTSCEFAEDYLWRGPQRARDSCARWVEITRPVPACRGSPDHLILQQACRSLSVAAAAVSAGFDFFGPRFFTSISRIRSRSSTGAYIPLGRNISARVSFS